MVPILRLGLKNKGTEKEPRAPVPWASPLLGLKPPKNENQRKATVEDRGQHLRQCVEWGAALPRVEHSMHHQLRPTAHLEGLLPTPGHPCLLQGHREPHLGPGTSEVADRSPGAYRHF